MNSFFSKSALLAIGLFLAIPANAAIVNEYWIDEANGIGGYDLINSTTSNIYGFAVGSSSATAADNFSDTVAWNSYVITHSEWDLGLYLEIADVDTQTLGTFESLFAATSDRAVLYAYDAFSLNPTYLAVDTMATGFQFNTFGLVSQYVTFDRNYAIIDQGQATHPSAVPVPAAAWLFISGIIGLAGVARRKIRDI